MRSAAATLKGLGAASPVLGAPSEPAGWCALVAAGTPALRGSACGRWVSVPRDSSVVLRGPRLGPGHSAQPRPSLAVRLSSRGRRGPWEVQGGRERKQQARRALGGPSHGESHGGRLSGRLRGARAAPAWGWHRGQRRSGRSRQPRLQPPASEACVGTELRLLPCVLALKAVVNENQTFPSRCFCSKFFGNQRFKASANFSNKER